MRNTLLLLTASILIAATGISCKRLQKQSYSEKTGWAYNDPEWGGFQKYPKVEQATGPGLIVIEGGTFIMGSLEQDLIYANNSPNRQVTINTFYMDETEVTNSHWLEYLYWLQRVYRNIPEVYQSALPDTSVWRHPLSYNEPYVDNYLRHPAFQDYPVVGVTWTQANEYCIWRTDRVNEGILIKKGIIQHDPNQEGDNNFNTNSYYAGQYETLVGDKQLKRLENMDPNAERPYRDVRPTDGIMLPSYRLPTEAEWEYAALALVGNQEFENWEEKKIYPWNGHSLRSPKGKTQGLFLANFKRGAGDNKGIAGYGNDNAYITAAVKSYPANDFGLYDMAGNVSEWVQDVYRPLSFEDVSDFNPFRGNIYTTFLRDDAGNILPKDSLGRLQETIDTINYENPDFRGYMDDEEHYRYGESSLITDRSRVYKGGSWNDRAYWLTPGSRRYLDQDSATATIGFRCAMISVSEDASDLPKSQRRKGFPKPKARKW